MRLTSDTYAVYQQLSEERKNDFSCIKEEALYMAFAADSFAVYERFVARRVHSEELVDISSD